MIRTLTIGGALVTGSDALLRLQHVADATAES